MSELEQQLAEVVERAVAAALAEHLKPDPGTREPSWRLVSVDEVAGVLGRSPRWVHDATKNRGLPYVRLDQGGKRFDLEDVREWARGRRVGS